jgi:hypothetical protein
VRVSHPDEGIARLYPGIRRELILRKRRQDERFWAVFGGTFPKQKMVSTERAGKDLLNTGERRMREERNYDGEFAIIIWVMPARFALRYGLI